MLVRQLQRPLSRPAAAAWRSGSAPTAALLHGSSRLREDDSQKPNPPPSPSPQSPANNDNDNNNNNNSNDTNDASRQTAPKKSPSLFEQLFPEETKHARSQSNGASKSVWVSQLFDDPPGSRTVAEDELNTAEPGTGSSEDPTETDPTASRPDSGKSMLILSAASKHLVESDFLRLAAKGKHVDGWVGGILKVIQARDPDTLRPLGHYFILFDRPEAAQAYRDEVERLWRLGRTYIPGARHKKDSERRQPVPEGLLTDRGEDVASALRAFTLVPPSQRYRLELSRQPPAQVERLAAGLGGGGGEVGEGAFVDRLGRRLGSRFLVLVGVDGGRISPDTLRRAIEDDGADRNLPWRVKDVDRGVGCGCVVPFGKSIVKRPDVTFEQSLRDQVARETGPDRDRDGRRGLAGDNEIREAADADLDGGGDDDAAEVEHGRRYRRYPRFLVPFVDHAEAQRFVRSWHRRMITLRLGHEDNEQVSWEESRIINATVLW